MNRKERKELVEKEKDLIKKIIVSRINNDGNEDLYVEGLKQMIEQNNETIEDFFLSNEGIEYIDAVLAEDDSIDEKEPTNDVTSNMFYKLFCDYLSVSNPIKSWNEDYEMGEHYAVK